MAFVNCKIKEENRRKYELPGSSTRKSGEFEGGTIDDINDIRLHEYSCGPVMESTDVHAFVFDYKGKVLYPRLKRKTMSSDVYWYKVDLGGIDYNKEILNSFKNAMNVFAYEGYKIWNDNKDMNGNI